MYWIATSPRLSRGRSTPAMRAMAAPFSCSLALPLLVARVLADDADAPRAPHDLAVLAPYLDRRSDFHIFSSRIISPLVSGPPGRLRHSAALHLALLLKSVRDPAARQVIGGELHLDLVPGQDPDEVHAHLAGHVREHLVAVVELHAKHGVRQRLDHGALHLDRVFFRHG